MPIDDLWYLKVRGPDKKRLPSKRHGRGKRWRVRYADAAGEGRERLFERKTDAEAFDLAARTGTAPETKLAQAERHITFGEYAERWRRSRKVSQTLDYQRHLDKWLRHHIYPYFGETAIRAITVTSVLEWLGAEMDSGSAQSSIRTYFAAFNAAMNAGVVDKVVPDNPCKAIRLSNVLRGFSYAPKWVPTTEETLALLDVVPQRFKAAIWLGAGAGMRLGEVLGIENGPRCVDYLRREIHVVQQLRFHRQEYDGFYLAPPKAGSSGDVDLDDDVAVALAEHVRRFPPVDVELPDITRGTPDPGKPATRRAAALLMTDERGKPLHDQVWSLLWARWRTAAGWPKEGTFHSLRHYFATALITAGADPTDVQKALRHSSPRITLETYVHWWPKKDRPRNVIGSALRDAGAARNEGRGSAHGG
jgi:integrase